MVVAFYVLGTSYFQIGWNTLPQKIVHFVFHVFFSKSIECPGSSAFTVEGFSSWKKVNERKNCSLLSQMDKDPNSPHKVVMRCYDLTNQSQHIEKIVEK